MFIRQQQHPSHHRDATQTVCNIRASRRRVRRPRSVQVRSLGSNDPEYPPTGFGNPEAAVAGSAVLGSGAAATSLAHLWPGVDWTRYHVQVLFVDRTDTVRARLAAGLFERCAEWNGYGRVLCPWTCGLAVPSPAQPLAARPCPARLPSAASAASLSGAGLGRLAALLSCGGALGLGAATFTRPAEGFELADLDRFDLVCALDSTIMADIRAAVALEHGGGPDLEYYLRKVCLLTSFNHYESDAVLTRRGGFALLPAGMAGRLQQGLQASKAVVDIPTPDLTSPDGPAQWDATVAALICSTASLVKYLIDAYPENLPHYDPVD